MIFREDHKNLFGNKEDQAKLTTWQMFKIAQKNSGIAKRRDYEFEKKNVYMHVSLYKRS